MALAILALGCELGARATSAWQQRLGLDTRRIEEILEEQTTLIHARIADADEDEVIELDSLLGWQNRPGHRSAQHLINAAGMRSAREYTVRPSAASVRAAAFGDAYTYGAEVSTAEGWSAVIERSDPSMEILNFGVGGYGTDQAFLRYLRDGAAYAPDVVLLGFSPVNLRRGVSRYTRFLSSREPPLTKPRYLLDEAGRLELVPNPLPSRSDWERLRADPRSVRALGVDDAWYDTWRYENPLYDLLASMRVAVDGSYRVWRKFLWSGRLYADRQFRPGAPAFGVQRAVLNAFADSVRARGAVPIIVIFPDDESLWTAMSGAPTVYAPLADTLRDADGLEVLDLVDALAEHARTQGGEGIFAPGGHLGPAGNAAVARRIAARLREVAPRR